MRRLRPSLALPATGEKSTRGFTLVEMLVTLAILSLISVVLAGMSAEVGRGYGISQNETDRRMAIRTVLDYMAKEMRIASISLNQSSALSQGKGTLQMLITPTSSLNYPDSVFWQAPIATDGQSKGEMAEVGYFIRWSSGQASLCRFFVNPTDTANYLLYSNPSNWLSTSLLNSVAPSDHADSYRGLFLDNVIGLWVQASPDPNISGTSYSKPYNSSLPQTPGHPLPASITISLVVLDAPSAIRFQNANASAGSAPPTAISSLYGDTPQVFADNVNAMSLVKGGATVVSTSVSMANYR
jgi:prepilin-type N-terminal cleavage/methylation domain-containing protein